MSRALQRAQELLAAARREREARYAPLRRRAAPPPSAPSAIPRPSAPAITTRRGKTIVLGRDGNGIAFTLDETSRREHMVMSGTTGGGKSNLLATMARQDIENGHGILFVDPHEDSGNPEPVLAAFGLEAPAGATYIGDGRHMAFWVNQGGARFRAVAFNARRDGPGAFRPPGLFPPLRESKLNRWRGETKIELEVREIRVE